MRSMRSILVVVAHDGCRFAGAVGSEEAVDRSVAMAAAAYERRSPDPDLPRLIGGLQREFGINHGTAWLI